MTDLPMARPLEPCEPSFDVFECGCGRHVRAKGCNKVDCPTCRPWLTLRRAGSVFDRLEKRAAGRPVCYTVLTFPESARERLADPLVLQAFRRRAWSLLKKAGADFGYCTVHPVGSQRVCPDCGYAVRFTSRRYCPECGAAFNTEDGVVFHPHFNFLWVPRPGFRGFLPVEELRAAWTEIVTGVDNTVVYHQYTEDRRRVRHWSKYVARTFPGWAWYTGSVRWFGRPPKADKFERCACEKCGQMPRFVGNVARYQVETWEQFGRTMGLDPPWAASRMERCP